MMKKYFCIGTGGFFLMMATGVYAACSEEQREQGMVEVSESQSASYHSEDCVDESTIKLNAGERIKLDNNKSCYPPNSIAAPQGGCISAISFRSDETRSPRMDICFDSSGYFQPVFRRKDVVNALNLTITGTRIEEQRYIWNTDEFNFVWPLTKLPIAHKTVYRIGLST